MSSLPMSGATSSTTHFQRPRGLFATMLCGLLLASGLGAQPRRDSVSASAPLPSVRELVARLPGEPVSLESLLRVASREGLAGRIATAEAQRAEGSALRASRTTDPSIALLSGVASDLFGGGQGRAVSNAMEGTAGLRWGTDLSVSYVRQDGSGFDPVRQLAAPSTFAVSVSQPLLEGRSDRELTWRAAERERTASDFARTRAWQEVATTVELLYWSLAEAQSTEAVRERSLELSERTLERSAQRVRLQLAPESDLLTVQSGVALRRAALVNARQVRLEHSDALVFAAYGERAAARLADGVLLRTTDDDALLPIDTTARNATRDAEAALSRALAVRADVRAARERRDAAEARYELAEQALRPSLSLEGGWASVTNPASLAGGAPGSLRGWRAGVMLSAPLRNRDDRGRVTAAAADRDVESLRLQEVENVVRRELRASARAVELTRERLAIVEEAAELAARQLEAERQRQELGLGDVFRLLQTEEVAVQAQLESVRARYDLLRAQARLRLATGTSHGAP